MNTYKRTEYTLNGEKKMRYFRNNLITKESTVPQEVKDKLMYSPEVEFDNQPENAHRCIWCDAPGTRMRYLNQETVYNCDYHYHNTSLGAVAHQVNILKEEEHKQWLLQRETLAKVVLKKRRTARRGKRNSTLSTPVKVATQ